MAGPSPAPVPVVLPDMGALVKDMMVDTLSTVFYSVGGQIMVVTFLVRALVVVWPTVNALARNAAAISASRAR